MAEVIRIATNKRRGRAVVYNGTIFIGGMVAEDRSQGIREQTEQALAKIDAALADAGSDRSHLLTAQIWMKDIARDFAAFNEVWDAWVDPDNLPARATTQCELGAPDAVIEIVTTAAVRVD